MGDTYIEIGKLRKGVLVGYNDEVAIIITDESWIDATKLRLGNRNPSGWLACLSGDVQSGNTKSPDLYEKGKIGIYHDDNYPKDTEAYAIGFFLQLPGGRDDATDIKCFEVTTDFVEVFGKRVFFNDHRGDGFAAGVTVLYMTMLNRPPENGIIEFWRNATQSNLDIVRQSILDSPEYAALHGRTIVKTKRARAMAMPNRSALRSPHRTITAKKAKKR